MIDLDEVGRNAEDHYLDLLKRYLTRYGTTESWRPIRPHRRTVSWIVGAPLQRLLARFDMGLCRRITLGATERAAAGGPRPADAETMVGLDRLDHLQGLLVDVLRRDVPGDVIELGVWRGGTTIFMRGLLKIYGESQRTVWVADSFAGPPKPDSATYPADSGRRWWAITSMAVSLEEVQRNFERYGLLDQQVRFLPGYFRETLPTAPIERLSLMRLDAVMYESTIQALDQLYPKMSPGGYVVVDDYSVPEVRSAVADYRAQHGVTGPIEPIDARASYWRVAD